MKVLKIALEKNRCTLHAYCLMSNHFHLLLETDDIEVAKFMKDLAGNYAMYFNRKYGYSGHVFEGRYKSCLVKNDTYFLQCSRYIHLNPVKAGMVKSAEEYRWSSYRTVVAIQDDEITQVKQTWEYFQKNPSACYRKFVEEHGEQYQEHETNIQKEIGDD